MGNLGVGMVVHLFLDVVKASAVASVGILLVFAASPLLEKRHTVFWRYFLFLCLAIRLALPFDISLSKWAAVIPVSIGSEAGDGILGDTGEEAVSLENRASGMQGEDSLKETAAREDSLRGIRADAQEEAGLENRASGMQGEDSKEIKGASLMAAGGQRGIGNVAQERKLATGAENETPFAKDRILWWAALCWAAGTVIYWAWQIGCYGAFIHKVKESKCFMGQKGRIPIYTTQAIATPMLAGIWKPQILLPPGEYGERQLEYILNHEFAHYQRKDLWVRLLLSAARAVHWFNPLVAKMERRAVKDIEFLCDSQVVRSFTKEEKKQYGRTLLAFADSAGSRRPILCTSGLSRDGEALRERFANLLSGQKKKGVWTAAFGVAGLLVASLFVAFGPPASATERRQAVRQSEDSGQAEGGVKLAKGAKAEGGTKAEERAKRENGEPDTQGKTAAISSKETSGAKTLKEEHAVIGLTAQMQNEEPIAPPGPKPEIVADQAEITKENAPEEMVNLLHTQEENLIYVRKGYEASEIYKNKNGDRYGFDWAGNLVSFKTSMDLFVYGAAKSTVEECREAADYYLSFLVDDPSYYTFISGYYRAEKHCYIFYYGHDVQGMVTNDRIEIWVHDLHQSLAYFENPRSGVFKEMDDAVVEEEKIFQKALELFNQRHKHEGELINPTLENITVRHKPKRKDKGKIGYEVTFNVANKDICGCETVQFVPFDSVVQR